jgi:hypothetical protein
MYPPQEPSDTGRFFADLSSGRFFADLSSGRFFVIIYSGRFFVIIYSGRFLPATHKPSKYSAYSMVATQK